jgi:hypothetical protein
MGSKRILGPVHHYDCTSNLLTSYGNDDGCKSEYSLAAIDSGCRFILCSKSSLRLFEKYRILKLGLAAGRPHKWMH